MTAKNKIRLKLFLGAMIFFFIFNIIVDVLFKSTIDYMQHFFSALLFGIFMALVLPEITNNKKSAKSN